MREVWLVEEGEYEDRMVLAVAESREGALAYVREWVGDAELVVTDPRGDFITAEAKLDAIPGSRAAYTPYFTIHSATFVAD